MKPRPSIASNDSSRPSQAARDDRRGFWPPRGIHTSSIRSAIAGLFLLHQTLSGYCQVEPAGTEPEDVKAAQKPSPGTGAPTKPRKADEQDLKAAFILTFPAYVTWPKESAQEKNIVIGMIGDDPKIATALTEAIKTKASAGPVYKFIRVKELAQARDCHILFIARSETRKLSEIISALKEKPTLTVGDSDGFAEAGGGIRLLIADTKLKMEINRASLEAAGLKASSRLLRIGIRSDEPAPK